MSKFFERVATPEKQMQQSKAPSGPNVDVNARAEAQNEYNNSIGKAIGDVLGITHSVAQSINKNDEFELEMMRTEHDLDASNDTRDSGTFIKTYIDSKDKNKRIEEYSSDELSRLTKEATQKYISEKKFGDKSYFSLIKEKIDKKSSTFLDKQYVINETYKRNKRYDVFVDEASVIASSIDDVEELSMELKGLVEQHVGADSEIQDTQSNAKLRILQRVMHDAIGKRDINALKKLKSKEMKEFFDIPDYDNAVQVLEKQTQSKVNELRQLSKDRLEEQVYLGIQNNGFKDSKQVEEWFDDQLSQLSEEQTPDTRDILKLKADAMGAMEEQATYEKVYAAVREGDSTLMERIGMKKKQRDSFNNKMFTDETGIADLSPDGIETAVISGDSDAPIKSYFNRFGSVPPALKLYGSTAPSGGIASLKRKRDVFMNMSVISEGTPVSLEDVYSPEELTRMSYVGRLLEDAEDGVISESEVSQAYRNFNNDIKKNTDTFGNYVSPKAAEFLHDDDTKEWLTENVKDASWTTDEFSAQSYRRRQFTHYFSLAMENTDDPAVARERAEKMFNARHRDVEAPNGEETVLPDEYMGYKVRDFLKVAQNHPDFDPFRALGYFGTGAGKETYFNRSISFTPDASYEKNKIMNLYYGEGIDKKLVMSVTPDRFESILNAVNQRIVTEAKKRRRQRMEDAKKNMNK